MGSLTPTSRRTLPIVGAVAAVALIAALPLGLSRIRDDSPRMDESEPFVLSDHFPVADRYGEIRYREVVVPALAGATVLSVGVTRTGLAVTYETNVPGNTVRLFNAAGTRVREFHDVIGFAMADRTSDLVAFQQDTTPTATADNPAEQSDAHPGIAPSADIVAASTSSGKEVGRTGSAQDQLVTAVAAGKVAISDDDVTRLWEPGHRPARVAFIPDEYMVVAMTPDRIVAALNEERTKVFDLEGNPITESDRLTSFSASASGRHFAGSTADGDLLIVDLVNGDSRLLHPPTEAGLVTYSADGEFVLTLGDLAVSDPPRSVCPADPHKSCIKVTTRDGFYLPNEAVLQFLAVAGA